MVISTTLNRNDHQMTTAVTRSESVIQLVTSRSRSKKPLALSCIIRVMSQYLDLRCGIAVFVGNSWIVFARVHAEVSSIVCCFMSAVVFPHRLRARCLGVSSIEVNQIEDVKTADHKKTMVDLSDKHVPLPSTSPYVPHLQFR